MKENANLPPPRKSLALELAMQIVSNSFVDDSDILQCLDLSQDFDSNSVQQFLKAKMQQKNDIQTLNSNAAGRYAPVVNSSTVVQKRKVCSVVPCFLVQDSLFLK